MNKEEVIVQRTWGELMHMLFEVLNYPLFELDGHPVSLGKLITGMVMLIVGYLVSRRASGEVDRRLLTRMNMDESLRYTMRRFLFYLFVCVTTLFTLHTLAVPVTIFTVIGGALAVGIGFGSQNLVNNFISGVLVMVERPIRVGDYIEVDGTTGQVESIGIRSTVIRAGFNAVTVIPNTIFIEKKLTNWTMSQRIVSNVRVGVAYGTNTKRLSELVTAAAKEMPEVMNDPAPWIIFVDFGDNALIFDVFYNLNAYDFPNKGKIDSALRFRLNDLFTQHKIEVPFPQRQLHMYPGTSLPAKAENQVQV